ncbi:RNA recognition motif. (a.k.a. RRM, RBD, or RNP domain), putative [Angomonas deanei]|uniref:RNA recognition motif. (A.k.a. RRM, RBD, or RNP domain), putative n=1 Tax=Angomonas deanei TaxID=59799 RepID=A0A7G2CE05_9TRYP|nr:RNA recognition motif. (a.k.a. RRM, RBD, or RNP domain), putative [Angomonas deanei]CAD2216372.1 RNA recognition motif. (a.k.a. RRM, RBD, or RNP domain), putative [Angomonas deanei]
MPPKAAKAAPKPAAKKAATKAAAPKPAAAPKAAAKPSQGAAGNSNGVYVKNWGTGSVADATEVFSAAGAVQSVRVRRHKYAIVFFDNQAAVKKAIDLFNEKEIAGQVVTVAPAKASPKADAHANSSSVFISPIFRTSATTAQIKELFNGYKVLRVRTYRKNFAYAYFDSPATAAKFVQDKNASEFRGHKLRVLPSAKSLDKLKAHQKHADVVIEAHKAAVNKKH